MKKVLSIVLALLMMFALGVVAVAADNDSGVLETGAKPISKYVAILALAQYHGTDTAHIKGWYIFVENPEQMIVDVYDAYYKPNEYAMYIYYGTDGLIHSSAGWSLELASSSDVEHDTAVTADVIGDTVVAVFDIAKLALDFILKNPLLSLIIGIGFAYTAFTLIARGMRVAKKS